MKLHEAPKAPSKPLVLLFVFYLLLLPAEAEKNRLMTQTTFFHTHMDKQVYLKPVAKEVKTVSKKKAPAAVSDETAGLRRVSIELPTLVLDEAAYLLAIECLGAVSSTDIKTNFNDFINSAYVLSQYPDLKLWEPKSRREWLAEARWRSFYSFDCVTLRCAWVTALLQQTATRAACERVFQRFGLNDSYVRLYMECLKDTEVLNNISLMFHHSFTSETVLSEFTLDPIKLHAEMEQDFKSRKMWAAARAKAGAKLSFIAKYDAVSRDDLASDLLVRAIAYYFKARPFYTRLHAANKAKAAMDGGVQQRLAQHNADPIRGGIRSDRTGYMTTFVQLTHESSEDNHEAFEDSSHPPSEAIDEVDRAAVEDYAAGVTAAHHH